MSVETRYRWDNGALTPAPPLPGQPAAPLLVADSWLISEGKVRALALHRERFLASLREWGTDATDAERFWQAAVRLLPRHGEWFPRVEARATTDAAGASAPRLFLQLRTAPAPARSVVVATLAGPDPRTAPRIKGPDLDRLAGARRTVAPLGAGEAIILTPEGYVVEGAYSGLLWWRGDILCGPLADFDRVDSVTVRSVLALAMALGIETFEEAVTPAELDGTELWTLNALHGTRIVTRWIDGPALAELPGRLGTWRARLTALRQPL